MLNLGCLRELVDKVGAGADAQRAGLGGHDGFAHMRGVGTRVIHHRGDLPCPVVDCMA